MLTLSSTRSLLFDVLNNESPKLRGYKNLKLRANLRKDLFKDSSFQNTAEFIGSVRGILLVIQLGYVNSIKQVGLGLIGDSREAVPQRNFSTFKFNLFDC